MFVSSFLVVGRVASDAGFVQSQRIDLSVFGAIAGGQGLAQPPAGCPWSSLWGGGSK